MIPDGRISRIRFEVAAQPIGLSLLTARAFLCIAASLSCGQHALLAPEFALALAITGCWDFAPAQRLAARSHDSGCVPRGPLLQECYLPSTLLRPHVPVHLPLLTFASTLGQ